MSKVTDVVKKTILIGNRPFALTLGNELTFCIDGPMFFAIFTRHMTKDLLLKLKFQIRNSKLCTNLMLSPEKSGKQVMVRAMKKNVLASDFKNSPAIK